MRGYASLVRFGVRIAASAALALAAGATGSGREAAKGTLTYKARSGPGVVAVKHAFLVKGPEMGSGKIIRRLVFAVEDVGPALAKCGTMMCTDGGINEGMTVDFDSGPRLNYWFVANGQRVQYSGTADPSAATLTVDTPERMAGRLNIDGRAAGGPLVEVEFDVKLLKQVK